MQLGQRVQITTVCESPDKDKIPPVTMGRPKQEIWDQLGDMDCQTKKIPRVTEAFTKVKERVKMCMGLHVRGKKRQWKDISGKMPSDSPRRLDASMRPQTPSNGSDIGSTSTGIDAVSIVAYSEDSDGPMTVSLGIDAASLSDSSLESEVLESLPSSPDVQEHDDEGIEIPLRDII